MRICMSMNIVRRILFVRKLRQFAFIIIWPTAAGLIWLWCSRIIVEQSPYFPVTVNHSTKPILSFYKLNKHIKACYWHCKINMDEEVGLALFMQNFLSSILHRYREIADWSYLSGLRHSYSLANIPLIISIRLCHRRGSRMGKTLVKIL